MDNKKFKKTFQITVPAADKENSLVITPGSKGFAILSDTSGKFKIGVNIPDLREALHECDILASIYCEQKEPEVIQAGQILEGDEE